MFLGFPLDYQTPDFIKAAVAPFGRLLWWYEGPNKSRVLVQCLLLSLDRVPRTVVVSQGTLLGGNGRSWSVPTLILDGQFSDIFPPDEDPVPVDGNPHPMHGAVNNVNPNVVQGWWHDFVGAAQVVHADAGLNAEEMAGFQEALANPGQMDENNAANAAWAQWVDQKVNLEEQQADNDDVVMEEVQQ